MTSPETATALERLGPRALRRAAPRLGPVLGGAGAVLAFIGLVVLSFDTSGIDDGDGDSNKMIGVLLCAAGVAAGYALVARFRAGGLATFGSVVAVLLLPFMLFFLTFDDNDLPPFSVDVVLMLSVAGWLLGYLLGPARGRPLFLGAAAAGLWLFILEQVESAFTAPFEILPVPFPVDDFSRQSPPDAGTIGLVCLIFGLGYLSLASLLDRRGLHGMVPPFLVVGFLALYTGFFAVQEDLEPAGAGALLVGAGLIIVFIATRMDRRGSAWLGGAAVAIGAAWIVGDAFENTDSVTAPAITLMIVGAAVALAGDRWAAAMSEPSELALATAVVVDADVEAPVEPVSGPPLAPPTEMEGGDEDEPTA